MKPKGENTPVYKMADLFIDPVFEGYNTEDFSININCPIIEHEIYKKHFRTDCFLIFVVLQGELTLNINLQEYRIEKNDIVVTTPNDLKRSNYNNNTQVLISGIAFTANFMTKAIDMVKNLPEVFSYLSYQLTPHWSLDTKDANTVKKLMLQISERYTTLNEHPFGKELFYSTFNIFMYELAGFAKKYSNLKNPNLSRKENLVMNFVTLLQKQAKFQRNVQAYASQLHITPKYLTETVKEISGKSAGEIIDDFVIQEAKLLLSDSNLSIAQIAEELRFSDQSFFGKFFKRHTGISPKEYRKL